MVEHPLPTATHTTPTAHARSIAMTHRI